MSKKRDYIPAGNKAFFDWQDNLVGLVVINAATWLIAAGKVTALQAAQAIYVPLYNAIKVKATRTPQQIDAHKQGRKVYIKTLRTFVKENLIGNTAITHDEKLGLGLNPGDGMHHARPKIMTAPVVNLFALGNLQVRVECRVIGDESRPSMEQYADCLEFRGAIGDKVPATYKDATNISSITKARFTQTIPDPTLVGQTIYVFARWKNDVDDTKSGPWSQMAFVVIR